MIHPIRITLILLGDAAPDIPFRSVSLSILIDMDYMLPVVKCGDEDGS